MPEKRKVGKRTTGKKIEQRKKQGEQQQKITESIEKETGMEMQSEIERGREREREREDGRTIVEKQEIAQSFSSETAGTELTYKSESESAQERIKNIVSKIQNRVSSKVQMAKNMYSLFQGMRNMYGGDTKKVISVMLNFAKDEAKRRFNEQKEKIKKKLLG